MAWFAFLKSGKKNTNDNIHRQDTKRNTQEQEQSKWHSTKLGVKSGMKPFKLFHQITHTHSVSYYYYHVPYSLYSLSISIVHVVIIIII